MTGLGAEVLCELCRAVQRRREGAHRFAHLVDVLNPEEHQLGIVVPCEPKQSAAKHAWMQS